MGKWTVDRRQEEPQSWRQQVLSREQPYTGNIRRRTGFGTVVIDKHTVNNIFVKFKINVRDSESRSKFIYSKPVLTWGCTAAYALGCMVLHKYGVLVGDCVGSPITKRTIFSSISGDFRIEAILNLPH